MLREGTGADQMHYQRAFARCNLSPGTEWDGAAARDRVRALWEALEGSPAADRPLAVVTLGRRVESLLRPFPAAGRPRFHIPHPSGRCRDYNDPVRKLEVVELLARLYFSVDPYKAIPDMQTWLPYPNFAACVAVLDNHRLLKMVSESHQIIRAIQRGEEIWTRHRAVSMWIGHIRSLALYHDMCVREAQRRGLDGIPETVSMCDDPRLATPPAWLGDEDLHASHRAMLKARSPDHYSRMGWDEEPSFTVAFGERWQPVHAPLPEAAMTQLGKLA